MNYLIYYSFWQLIWIIFYGSSQAAQGLIASICSMVVAVSWLRTNKGSPARLMQGISEHVNWPDNYAIISDHENAFILRELQSSSFIVDQFHIMILHQINKSIVNWALSNYSQQKISTHYLWQLNLYAKLPRCSTWKDELFATGSKHGTPKRQ